MSEKASVPSDKRGHVSAAEGNSGAPEPGTRSYRSLWQMKRGPSRDSAHTWFHLQQSREADTVRTEEHAAVCPNSTALADERADACLVPFTTVVRMTSVCLFSEEGG